MAPGEIQRRKGNAGGALGGKDARKRRQNVCRWGDEASSRGEESNAFMENQTVTDFNLAGLLEAGTVVRCGGMGYIPCSCLSLFCCTLGRGWNGRKIGNACYRCVRKWWAKKVRLLSSSPVSPSLLFHPIVTALILEGRHNDSRSTGIRCPMLEGPSKERSGEGGGKTGAGR